MIQKKQSSSTLKYINYILVLLALFYLGYKFNSYHEQHYGELFISLFKNGQLPILIIAFSLMAVNYGIEALKWQLLISPLEKVAWPNALKSIMAGITVSIFTPNRTGEVIGKVAYLNLAEKAKAALLNFSGSMAQMICTSLFGLWSLLLYVKYYTLTQIQLPSQTVIFFIASFCTLLAFLIYFNQHKFFTYISTKSWAKRFHISFTNTQQFNTNLQVKVLFLSALRYFVFSTQLVLLLLFCGVQAPLIQLYLLTAVFFLIMWFFPSFAITDLGIRGSIAVLLFQHLSNNISGELLAVVLLWIINVALPALIGCLYVFQLKFNWKQW